MKRFIPYVLLLMSIAVGFLWAEEDPQFVEFLHVRKDVDKVLKKHQFVVFYGYHMPLEARKETILPNGEKEHTAVWHEIMRVSNMLDEYAGSELYEDRVFFVASNFDRGDMASFKRDYNLKGDTILLIKNGKIMGQADLKTGFLKADFQKMLDITHFEDFLDSARKADEKKARKEAEQKKKQRTCRSCSNVSVSFGAGVGYYPSFYDSWFNGPTCYTCTPYWW